MIELKGKYNKDCKIFIDDVENDAISLIQSILDKKVSENVPVRIMPDTHLGKGITIGFTMSLTSLLSPSYVGVDIGCGVDSVKFKMGGKIDLKSINNKIRSVIPMGFNIHKEGNFKDIPYDELNQIANKFIKSFNEKYKTNYVIPTYNEKWLDFKLKEIKMDVTKFWNSIGTLGGGNHFIELGKSNKDDSYWLTVHSGSRNFGLKIAEYWTNVAKGSVKKVPKEYNEKLNKIINNTNPKSLIPKKLEELKNEYGLGVEKEFLEGENLIGYLFDMIFAQQYAVWNRKTILKLIEEKLIIKIDEHITSSHNYIDFRDFIIRKGAISSYTGEKMIIPFNMRDGILICEGKSNSDWNYSAPHGAGRIMSRSKAKECVDLNSFQETMKGIYSTSVCKSTLDESPFAYKDSKIIEEAIKPTAIIIEKIKPILNIKDKSDGLSWKERKQKNKKNENKS